MAQSHNPSLITQNLAFCGDAAVKSVGGAGTRLYNQANVDSADVKLLIHGNEGSGNSFTDSSLSNHTITAVGDVTHSTTKTKFSGGSIYFDGVGDYLSVPDSSDWAFGTDDFTIDFWFNPTGFASYTGLIVQNPTTFGSTDSDHGLFIEVDSSSTKLRLFIRPLTDPYSADMFAEISQTGIVAGTWNHVAVVRETGANKISMYLNGQSCTGGGNPGGSGSSVWSGSTSYPDFATPLLIGVRNDQSDYFSGYMDEVRITKGAALWTQNFTPPARRDTLSISDGMMYNGNCVDFDGTDAYVTYGDVTWLDGLTTISVCCWLYQDGVPPETSGIFLSKNDALECWTKEGGTERYVMSINNDHQIFSGAPTPTKGEWVQIVMTWNSTGDVRKLYLNGELVDTNTSGNQGGNSINNTGDALSIGARPSGYEIDGKMADVKLFSKELSAANVKELYENSKVIIPTKNDASGDFLSQTDLALWAPLTDGVGTIAYDGSGYGRDGTYTGTSFLTGQTGCPQLITGYNRPMLFASSKYVEIPQNSALDIGTSDFTFAAWTFLKTGSEPNIAMQFAGAGGWRMVGASGKIRFSVFDNGWSNYASMDISPALTLNQWNHVAVSVNRDGNAQSYINGVAKSYLNVSGVTGTLTNTYPLRFGAGSYTSGAPTGDYIDGTINEAVLYDKALSASEIKALSTRGRLKELVVNGGFDSDMSGWTVNVGGSSSITSVNGQAKMVDAAASGCRFDTPSGSGITTVIGRYYLAKVTLGGDRGTYGGTGSWFKWMIGSNYQGAQYTNFAYVGSGGGSENHGGKHEFVFKAVGTSTYLGFTNGNDAGYVTVDDVSLVELGGPFDTSSQCLPPDAMTMGDDVAEQISAKSSNAAESTYSYGGITYKTWTYRSGGTFVVPRDIEVDVVVVGGGGGGGYNVGGGGGAGGLVSETLTAVQTADGGTSYSVVVGAGGLGRYASMSPPQCTSGGDSYITIDGATTAVGGGRGGGYITSWSDGPQSGGSGGGGRHSQGGAAGTAGQGNAGGSGTSSGGQYAGAGGGGAGAVGANAVFSSPNITAGDGGNGKNDFINSSAAETAALLAAALPGAVYLAGGGGGSRQGAGTTGAGGLGGGGKGSYYSTADGENGQVNTGGGGGGEMDGGSGVVIIRYAMPSPIGYWRNDGASTWTDLSGNGNNGTAVGSPSSLLFKQGYTASKSTDAGRDNQGFPLKFKNVGAIGFNGSDNEIVIADTSDLTFGNGTTDSPFSISAWINMEDATNFGVVTKNDTGLGEWRFVTDANDCLQILLSDLSASAYQWVQTSALTGYEGQWIFVTATYNGIGGTGARNGLSLYVNGIEQSVTGSYSGTYVAMENTGYEVRIGTLHHTTYSKGQVAGVQIYNRALTQTEIKQNFAAQANRFQVPRSIVTEGLVLNLDAGNPGSYPGSGTAWYDVSGNGCDFTLDGSGITYSASNGGIFSLTDPSNGGASTTSAITASTSCTLVFWMKTTDAQALFWSGPAVDGGYLGAYRSGNKFYNAAALGGASPTFYTNAVQRSNIYDFIRTGEWMMMEFKSVDMSSLTASHFNQYASYTFGGSSAVGKIMIYNRNLTSAESAQNFRVDRERFGV